MKEKNVKPKAKPKLTSELKAIEEALFGKDKGGFCGAEFDDKEETTSSSSDSSDSDSSSSKTSVEEKEIAPATWLDDKKETMEVAAARRKVQEDPIVRLLCTAFMQML